MANRNTRALIDHRRKQKAHKLGTVNSGAERAKSGRKPYQAPRMKEHPILAARNSFLKGKGMAH